MEHSSVLRLFIRSGIIMLAAPDNFLYNRRWRNQPESQISRGTQIEGWVYTSRLLPGKLETGRPVFHQLDGVPVRIGDPGLAGIIYAE